MGSGKCDDLLFGDRDSWFDHEIKNHRATYSCSLCESVRGVSKTNLRSHFATHGTFTDQQLHILEDAARDTGIRLRARDCPFCDEWADKLASRSVTSTRDDQGVVVSNVRFKRHVATHQEQLAIFALPRAIEEEETLHKEIVMNSNSGPESMCSYTDDEHKQYSLHREEPYPSQLQEPGTDGPPTGEPKDVENELEEAAGLSGLETMHDGDSDSDGPDIESVNSRALPQGLVVPQVLSATELTMAQASSKVSPNTQKKHQCKVCNKRFTRSSTLQTHMYSHTGEKRTLLYLEQRRPSIRWPLLTYTFSLCL